MAPGSTCAALPSPAPISSYRSGAVATTPGRPHQREETTSTNGCCACASPAAARQLRTRWGTSTTAPASRSRPSSTRRLPSRAPSGRGPIVLSWRVDRTADYGPLVARGTLEDGTPIAVASLRSTYRAELGSAPGFYKLNNPANMTNGFESFRTIMGEGVHYTFNWFYIDAQNIGYQHSCRCPQRAQGDDPYMPTWGTGQWDWQGYIPLSEQPTDFNPAEDTSSPGTTSRRRSSGRTTATSPTARCTAASCWRSGSGGDRGGQGRLD